MLPTYVKSDHHGKMNRQPFGNGFPKGSGAYPIGGGGRRGSSAFNIRPDKYEQYQPRSARGRRRGTAMRVGGILTAILLVLMFFFPALRPAGILGGLGLAARGGGEEFNIETVRYYDLANVGGTSRGWEREERILLCAPLRDAAPHMPMFFSHLRNLTYPHHLIDLAFLVGDSKDSTLTILSDMLAELQASEEPKMAFGEISVIEKDFGQKVNQDVESRHGFAAQASRRKSMAQARNWLLSAALRPTHSWVYWRDVDVETAPFTILEDLMRHNKDVIVPNVWRPLPDWLGGEQPYDLNSWQESETALALADTLDEDAVIVEGYAEYATWRPHLAYLRDPYGDPDMEMEIDGVGGVSILAKAKVFRSGVHFPAFSFEKHAETEGFGKMAKRMKFSVVGLPHYTIWHLYEPSVDDIRHMEEMEQERKQREQEEKEKKDRLDKIQSQFEEGSSQWDKDKEAIRDATKQDAAARQADKDAKKKAEAEEASTESNQQQSREQVEGGKVRIKDPLEEIPEGSDALEMDRLPPKLASDEQRAKWEDEQTQQAAKEDAKTKKKSNRKDRGKKSDTRPRATNPELTQKPFKQSDQKLAEAMVKSARTHGEGGEGGHKFKQEVEDALAAQELHEHLGELEEDALEREIEKHSHSAAS